MRLRMFGWNVYIRAEKRWLCDCPRCKDEPVAYCDFWGWHVQCPDCYLLLETKVGYHDQEKPETLQLVAQQWEEVCKGAK